METSLFSRLVFLLCAAVLVIAPVSQTPRTYKIHDLERLQKTVLKDVVEIKDTKNLQSINFPEDFEVEMKNISNKPIYYMFVAVVFSETPGGTPYGFDLKFGNKNLINISNRPDPTDIPAKPGETFILKAVNAKYARKYFASRIDSSNIETALSKIVLVFQIINFGDGTGYLVATPVSATKKVSQTPPWQYKIFREIFSSQH
jgi:hypothetical protein